MPTISLPTSTETDIYYYGFDRNLNKITVSPTTATQVESELVYNAVEGTIRGYISGAIISGPLIKTADSPNPRIELKEDNLYVYGGAAGGLTPIVVLHGYSGAGWSERGILQFDYPYDADAQHSCIGVINESRINQFSGYQKFYDHNLRNAQNSCPLFYILNSGKDAVMVLENDYQGTYNGTTIIQGDENLKSGPFDAFHLANRGKSSALVATNVYGHKTTNYCNVSEGSTSLWIVVSAQSTRAWGISWYATENQKRYAKISEGEKYCTFYYTSVNVPVTQTSGPTDATQTTIYVNSTDDFPAGEGLKIIAISYDITRLNGAINNSATTITVFSTSSFPSSGTIKIEQESITYTGKTDTTFTGCTRGANNTTAKAHSSNQVVKISADAELIAYTGKTDTTFTGCTRGIGGTPATTHSQYATVTLFSGMKLSGIPSSGSWSIADNFTDAAIVEPYIIDYDEGSLSDGTSAIYAQVFGRGLAIAAIGKGAIGYNTDPTAQDDDNWSNVRAPLRIVPYPRQPDIARSGDIYIKNDDHIYFRGESEWKTLANREDDVDCYLGHIEDNSSSFTTNSTTFVDVTNMTITATTRAKRVLLMFSGTHYNTTANRTNQFTFSVDGVQKGSSSNGLQGFRCTTDLAYYPVSFYYITDVLTAESHTFKVNMKVTGGTGGLIPTLMFSAIELI